MATIKLATYGKDEVRVFRKVIDSKGVHHVAEYVVRVLLQGDFNKAWTESDNTMIVATDSMKNTVNVFAKKSPHVLQPETFALDLGVHFTTFYKHVTKADVSITQLKWSRINVDGKPHKHSFVRDGDEKRLVHVLVDASAGKDKLEAVVEGGIQDLLVLKTTESYFKDFWRDEYRTLPDTDDRIMSTAVDCSYKIKLPKALTQSSLSNLGVDFDAIHKSVTRTTLDIFATHNSGSVQATLYNMCEKILEDNKHVQEVTYKLPNKHYFAVDLSFFGLSNTNSKDAEVFRPGKGEAAGLIIATVGRAQGSKL